MARRCATGGIVVGSGGRARSAGRGAKGPVISDARTWTSAECAHAWGVKTPTWLGYVSRGQAPVCLPETDERGRRLWDVEQVRTFPRPGAGRSRAGAAPEAQRLLAEMAEVAGRIDELRARQRELLLVGRADGLEVRAMARALAISPQTAYGWIADRTS